LKQYLEGEYKSKMLAFKQNQNNTTIPLRLGAYERLSLFCERISIPNLILRLRTDDMNATDLKFALMLGVQQEFEHNITQQVYVSDQLWQIVKIARDDTINIINLVYNSIDSSSDAKEYAGMMFKYLQSREVMSTDKALVAIKKEAGLLM